MGQIAYLLVSAFIVVAIFLDIRESRGKTSPAIWIPFLWFAVSISKPITYWIYPQRALEWTPVADLQGNPLERIFLSTLMTLGTFCIYKRRHNFCFSLKDNKYVVAFFILALASISWSAYPGPALKRWVRAVGDIIIILIILTEKDPQETFERILRRCAIILIPLSVYYIRYVRWIGVMYYHDGVPRFVGATGNKNQLGILCAFTGIFLAWRILSRRSRFNLIDLILFLLVLYLLNLSNSATSTVILITGLFLLVIQSVLNTNKKKLMRIVLLMFGLLLLLQTVFVGVLGDSVFSILFSTIGRDPTFTGRLPLWQRLIEIGSHRPLLGSGYGSFWLTDEAQELWNTFIWRPTTGHNGYLDVFMDLGLLGFIILILLIIHTFSKILRSYEMENQFNRLQLTILIMALMHNMTESSFGRGTVLLWILLIWLSIAIRKLEVET